MANGTVAPIGRSNQRESYLLTPGEEAARQFVVIGTYAIALLLLPLSVRVFHSTLWGICLGLAGWFLIIGETIKYGMASVPEITGLVTVNLFRKPTEEDRFYNMHVYGSGLHFIYWWEQKELGNYITLRVVNQPIEEDFPSASAENPSSPDQKKKDGGPLVNVKGVVMYRGNLKLLPVYISVDDTTINTTLLNVATSYLSDTIAGMGPEEARQSIKKFQEHIQDVFIGIKTGDESEDSTLQNLEDHYGIEVTQVSIGDTGYEDDYQNILTKKARAVRIHEMTEAFQKQGLSPDKAANAALITAGVVPKNVMELEGNAHEALAALLLNIGKGGGPQQTPPQPQQRKKGK